MTESNPTLNEVPALLEERRKYEAWLAALELRRDSTPAHVFDRVHADYTTRLQRVAQQLASHRQSIVEERTSVQARLSLLQTEELLRRDERAELDLRVHVGELSGSDADAAFRAVDDTIRTLLAEKDGLGRRLQDLDGLIDDRSIQQLAASQPAERPAAEPRHARAESKADQAAKPAAAQAQAPTAAPAPAPAAAADQSAGARIQTDGAPFDELAFLSEVVGGDKQPAVVRSDAVVDSLLDGLEKASRAGTREAPLAANVPSNTPIVLRTSGPTEQPKTLKCSECGAMNLPTEWYCERCGAELAAL